MQCPYEPTERYIVIQMLQAVPCFARRRHIHDRQHDSRDHLEKKYGQRRTAKDVPPARRFPRNRMLRDFSNRRGNLQPPVEPFSDLLDQTHEPFLSRFL